MKKINNKETFKEILNDIEIFEIQGENDNKQYIATKTDNQGLVTYYTVAIEDGTTELKPIEDMFTFLEKNKIELESLDKKDSRESYERKR